MSNDGGSPPPSPHYGDAPRYGYDQGSPARSAASASDPAASPQGPQGYPPPGYGSTPQPPQQQSYGQQPDYGQQPRYGAPAGQAYPATSQPYGSVNQPYPSTNQPYPPTNQPYQQQPYGNAPAGAWAQTWVPPNLAGWGRRVGAYLIDFAPGLLGSIIFYIGYIQWVVALSVATSSTNPGAALSTGVTPMIIGGVIMLASIGWDIYNRWITGGKTGQSLGKRVMKISLIAEQSGQPIGPLNAFLRDLVHVLDGMLYVGYLWPLWDERKQTFSDKIMKTYVVDVDRPGVTTGS